MSIPFMPPAFWLSGTNQNSIPANDNALRLWITQADVDNSTTAQPVSPGEGDVYIIQSVHTGAQWSTFTPDDVAIFSGGTWYAFEPVEGMRVSVAGAVFIYTSGAWTEAGGGSGSGGVQCIPIACSDETADLTTGTAKVTFRMPYAFTLSEVRSSLTGAPSGSVLTVDINEAGVSILSTKLTIDAGEKTSTTAAVPAVISDSSLADDAEITIDIDAVGSGGAGKGLKVYLIGTKT